MIKGIINGTEGAVEKIYVDILNRVHKEGPIYSQDFEKLSYIKLFHPNLFKEHEQELLNLTGLFYKIDVPKTPIELAYYCFKTAIIEWTGVSFTPMQADAYNRVRSNVFFSFSAPTSSGKSHLFRELIESFKADIVIVVPSRALIAEYTNIVREVINSNNDLVLNFVEDVNRNKVKRRIFIITPERGLSLFTFKEQLNIDLFLFDEAQLSDNEERGLRFDAFVRMVIHEFKNSKKVFAHPYVDNPESQFTKHHLLQEDKWSVAYKQNSVGKIFVSLDGNEYYYFSPYDSKIEAVPVGKNLISNIIQTKTILVYTTKKILYNHREFEIKFKEILDECLPITEKSALEKIEQLREYIGASNGIEGRKSFVVEWMRRGVVLHHGSMPLKIRYIIEDFVRCKHAKVCFATSTLNQGINMPFDAVYIDYFRMDSLTIKNLIGRSGRSTEKKEFEFGYTIVKKENVKTFSERVKTEYSLNNDSKLDNAIQDVDEDDLDIVEAVKYNTLDFETRLPKSQLDRIKSANIDKDIEYLLNNIFNDDLLITAESYYRKDNITHKKVKASFDKIYNVHLKRELTRAEKSVLNTAIYILLWRVEGKTFKEIIGRRYFYLARVSEQREIEEMLKTGEISKEIADSKLQKLKIKQTSVPFPLPNRKKMQIFTFSVGNRDREIEDHPDTEDKEKKMPYAMLSVKELDYDMLVFDTYDYIDKVIMMSMADPMCAVFTNYYEKTNDKRASIMCNLLRYGTNDEKEIWLLKYGYTHEEIEKIKKYVDEIDENEIIWFNTVEKIEDKDIKKLIDRYD